jgi:hypothetical protein
MKKAQVRMAERPPLTNWWQDNKQKALSVWNFKTFASSRLSVESFLHSYGLAQSPGVR